MYIMKSVAKIKVKMKHSQKIKFIFLVSARQILLIISYNHQEIYLTSEILTVLIYFIDIFTKEYLLELLIIFDGRT